MECYLAQSGSSPLNFDVKAYASEALLLAATPKENTIGIITTTPIAKWTISAERPEVMTDGDVWISSGTSSTVEFNALKKNGIQVYPLSAKQMVSGELKDVTAKTYQNGEWVEWWVWNGDLFNNGDQIERVTGGWIAVNGAGSKATIGDVITFTVPGSSGRDAAVFTKNKVKLEGYSEIEFTVNVTSTLGPVRVGVTSENTSYVPTFLSYAETRSTGSRVLTAKLEGTPNECYVAVYADQSALTVSKIRGIVG